MGMTAQMGPYAYGDQIKTSLHGRLSGLDNNNFGVGEAGTRDPQELWTAGSTGAGAASTAILSPGGISVLQPTSASTFQLPAPGALLVGVGKTIQFSGSPNMEIDLVSGNLQTSVSSTLTKITFTTTGAVLNGGLFLQCIQSSSGAFYWSLNGSTGAAGGGSTHIAFA